MQATNLREDQPHCVHEVYKKGEDVNLLSPADPSMLEFRPDFGAAWGGSLAPPSPFHPWGGAPVGAVLGFGWCRVTVCWVVCRHDWVHPRPGLVARSGLGSVHRGSVETTARWNGAGNSLHRRRAQGGGGLRLLGLC